MIICDPRGPLVDFRPMTRPAGSPSSLRIRLPGTAVPEKPQEKHHMQEYEKLKQLVEACAEDVAKAEGGNKAAGTRVRKAMQDIKNAAQDVRKTILEVRSSASE